MKNNQARVHIASYTIILAIVGVWFFCLNANTPFMHDDIAYHYLYDSNSAVERPTSEPVSSFWQIFPSMWNHYNAVNGRYTSHLIIQLFCGLLGKNLFNFFNTIVFLLFLDIIVILAYGKRELFPLSIVVTSVVFLLPFPGQTMLWLSGSVNYLWTSFFALLLLRFYLTSKNNSVPYIIFAFFLGVFSGWMNESISFGIAGGLVIYTYFNRHLFYGASRWAIMGYVLGCLMILLSPGTINRFSSGEINTELNILQLISSRIIGSFFIMKSLPLLALSVLFLVISFIKRCILDKSVLYILCFICLFLFCFLLGMPDHRVYFGLSVMGIIIIISSLKAFRLINCLTIKHVLSIIFFIICIPYCGEALKKTAEFKDINVCIDNEINSAKLGCVIESIPISSSRFVFATKVDGYTRELHNRVRAFYYDKTYVHAIPGDVYRFIQNGNIPFDDLPYWFVRWERNNKVNSVHYEVQIDNSYLKKSQVMVRYLLGSLKEIQYYNRSYFDFECNGDWYLAFPYEEDVRMILIRLTDGTEIKLSPSRNKHLINI